MIKIPIFDLDGTLLDSDAALIAPFLALGVPREEITFGHVVADECTRLGIALDDYVSRYDVGAAQPFPEVTDLLARLSQWGVCSNKHPDSGRAELDRLGWTPDIALFADAFDGPKCIDPVLEAMGLCPSQAVFIGDTDHDRACARSAGVDFILAGWNPRARPQPGDLVAQTPLEVEAMLSSMPGS
jgi:HAD superfamily hydrolase (TIGR01549 family)